MKIHSIAFIALIVMGWPVVSTYSQTSQPPVETPSGWLIEATHGELEIKLYNNQIAELEWMPSTRISSDTSHAVVLKPEKTPHSTTRISETEWLLTTDQLQFFLVTKPFKISILNQSDTLISDAADFRVFPGNSQVTVSIDSLEMIFGTGERAIPLNRRGYELPLYNKPNYGYGIGATSLNYSVPVVVSSKKYLMLWDNPQKGVVDIGKTRRDRLTWQAQGGQARYFIVVAETYPKLITNYTKLTGRQSLPPRWALGNLQSRMAYRNQKEADSVVKLMIANDFPIDALILDFYWFGDSIKGHLGRLDWFKPSWPEPEKMIQDFKRLGVKTILITEPYVIDSLENYSDGVASQIFVTDTLGQTYLDTNFYFGHGSLIDIFKPQAQDWFWRKYQHQIGKGIAGWWGDLGEPESHPSDIVHVNGRADEVHNIFGHYWDKMLFEKYRKHHPKTRLFHLQRSGFAGSQRYSAFPWTGDVGRSWSGLKAQLPLLLTMGINGLGYTHSDAGGFAMGEKDDELYTRWLQFAVFTPILRPHGSGVPSEPVYFSSETQQIVRSCMKLRYSLLPYNYTLAWQNASMGYPLMRPLFYSFSQDTTAANINYQYMWGDNMLVAPVLEPSIDTLDIYLPEGEWYDYHTTKQHKGSQWIKKHVTINTIPIYIKAGAFIPTIAPINSTDLYDASHYIIKYYPSGNSLFVQYEDDGIDNLAISENKFELITYSGTETADGWSVSISSKGDWPGKPTIRKMTFQVLTNHACREVSIVNKTAPETASRPLNQTFDQGFTTFEFDWDGNSLNINLVK